MSTTRSPSATSSTSTSAIGGVIKLFEPSVLVLAVPDQGAPAAATSCAWTRGNVARPDGRSRRRHPLGRDPPAGERQADGTASEQRPEPPEQAITEHRGSDQSAQFWPSTKASTLTTSSPSSGATRRSGSPRYAPGRPPRVLAETQAEPARRCCAGLLRPGAVPRRSRRQGRSRPAGARAQPGVAERLRPAGVRGRRATTS